ncbi:hypothetical protein REPUB_Repub17cG0139500 [Reevesia pubescens]
MFQDKNGLSKPIILGMRVQKRGREERCKLWFNPPQDFHTYSILWNKNWTIFYVDEVPIRQVRRIHAMGRDYPKKAMSLYATIWDGFKWRET